MKIVINVAEPPDWEGASQFDLSNEALFELGFIDCQDFFIDYDKYIKEIVKDEFRANPKLIEVVEKLGEKANGCNCELKIVEIPDDVEWQIKQDTRDGNEWVAEKHRTWE